MLPSSKFIERGLGGVSSLTLGIGGRLLLGVLGSGDLGSLRGSLGGKIGHHCGLHLGVRSSQRLVSVGLGDGRLAGRLDHCGKLGLGWFLLVGNQAIVSGLGSDLGLLFGGKIGFLFCQIRSLLVHRRLGSGSGGLGSLRSLVG